MDTDKITIEKQTNSFKLAKMSKGFNWEIKIYNDDIEQLKLKIKELNDWALNEYSGGISDD